MDPKANCNYWSPRPVPVFSRHKTLLVVSGQDSVVLAQAFESLRVPLEQGELAFPI